MIEGLQIKTTAIDGNGDAGLGPHGWNTVDIFQQQVAAADGAFFAREFDVKTPSGIAGIRKDGGCHAAAHARIRAGMAE